MAGGSTQAKEFIAEMLREEAYERKVRGEDEPMDEKTAKRKRSYQDPWIELEHGTTSLGRIVFRLYDQYAPQAPHEAPLIESPCIVSD